MKNKIISTAIILITSLAMAKNKTENSPKVEFVPGEFVVKLKVSPQKLLSNSLWTLSEPSSVEVLSEKHKLVLIKRNPVENQKSALQSLSNAQYVEYAEPNFIYRINKLPNDPKLGELWGLINKGQKDSAGASGKVGIDVDAERAWEMQTGTREVLVAVIDTGIGYNIEDLKENVWTNQAEANGEPGVDDDGNGFVDDIHGYDFVNNDGDPMDDHGHGSHCSGTIGARGNDQHGIVGVAWNVKIMGVKFLSGSGSGTLANAVKSIDYATQMGAQIMSNSWGGGGFSDALKESIERAYDKGILFTAAAGNHSGNNDDQPSYPSSYEVPNVVSVAAIDNKGKLASFSCYGKTSVDVAAPGVNILSTTPAGYKSWSGTSMATPHVTGVAALILSSEPGISVEDLKSRIINTARPVAALRGKMVSGGIVNAYFALRDEKAPADPEDPFSWNKYNYSLESDHPYKSDTKQTWSLEVPGANRIAVHFKRFETEANYDKVTFSTENKGTLETLSGKSDDSFSSVFDSNKVDMTFEADGSVNKYGFEIDYISYE